MSEARPSEALPRFRFYAEISATSFHDVVDFWASTFDDACRQASGWVAQPWAGMPRRPRVEVRPEWDAVILPDRRTMSRAEYEATFPAGYRPAVPDAPPIARYQP